MAGSPDLNRLTGQSPGAFFRQEANYSGDGLLQLIKVGRKNMKKWNQGRISALILFILGSFFRLITHDWTGEESSDYSIIQQIHIGLGIVSWLFCGFRTFNCPPSKMYYVGWIVVSIYHAALLFTVIMGAGTIGRLLNPLLFIPFLFFLTFALLSICYVFIARWR